MKLPRKGSFTGYNGAGGEAQHFLRFHTQLERIPKSVKRLSDKMRVIDNR
ncbi:hypothetical protein QBD00_001547 [Ochrobactrum sp. AN78]|nr:hypothetical protein [Ochrobactrum sp. AN78]